MKKVYQKPEFQIICQDQANAKFFVASMENNSGTPPTTQAGNVADTYTYGESQTSNSTVNENGGFTF